MDDPTPPPPGAIAILTLLITTVLIGLSLVNASQNNGPPVRSQNLFIERALYDDPNDEATVAATRHAEGSRESQALKKIGTQPWAIWFGDWDTDISDSIRTWREKAEATQALPIFVLYNIPDRDCNSADAGGGADGTAQYQRWIDGVAAGLSTSPSVFILEPDAVAGWDCPGSDLSRIRITQLQYAIDHLSDTNHAVYLDAGNPGWGTTQGMIDRLKRFDLEGLRGFAVNVSNFYDTPTATSYAEALYSATGLPSVIDTSRNGNGAVPGGNDWCNPAGRALGEPPQAVTDNPAVDAYLWIKIPGESDGKSGDTDTNCHGGPTSGDFWEQYAIELALNAHW
mgnify:CR=1 FL=1